MPINILEKNVAELIAAGEVIERPSSVIKELVENSIDAGAKRITIEINGGGVSFMRITDDGSGIPRSEAPLAFLRHATSKVKYESDLDKIITMGFRGEALASISAVAKIEMLTKTSDDKLGTLYKIAGGEEQEYAETGCPDGTTIIIRDLFYNTPARLKFLKKNISEGNAVQGIVEKIALINPNIAFRLIRDNKPTIITPGDGELISAVYSIFGKQFAASLIPVDFEQSDIGVSGFISSPLFCRGNRAMQHLFVNSRYVKSPSCTAALEEAYRNSTMTGKFPAAVLNITLNPSNVDVNVHPSKTEVRFTDDRSVFNAVYYAAKNAVLNAGNIKEIAIKPAPVSSDKPQNAQNQLSSSFERYTAKATPVNEILKMNFTSTDNKKTIFKQNTVIDTDFSEINAEKEKPQTFKYISGHFNNDKPTDKKSDETEIDLLPEKTEKLRIIGELWSTYIICENINETGSECLVLIDKHAAHERIRFEALKKEFFSTSQLLAESIFVTMDSQSRSVIIENADMLIDLGIEALNGENNTVEIISVPNALLGKNIEEILCGIADILKNGFSKTDEKAKEIVFGELLHSVACKSAIKAGDKSDITDLTLLANTVYADKSIRFCPHGRPIIITLSKYEIEKHFGRI